MVVNQAPPDINVLRTSGTSQRLLNVLATETRICHQINRGSMNDESHFQLHKSLIASCKDSTRFLSVSVKHIKITLDNAKFNYVAESHQISLLYYDIYINNFS